MNWTPGGEGGGKGGHGAPINSKACDRCFCRTHQG